MIRPGRFTLTFTLGELALVPLAWLVVWLWAGADLPPFRLEAKGVGIGLAGSVPPLLFLFWMVSPLGRDLPFVSRVRNLLGKFLGPTLARLSWWQMALVALAAGIGEETLFRGALQPRLGLFWASMIFGLLHAFTVSYALMATCLGAYLGWLWLQTGDLVVPVVAHGFYDFVALWVFRREMRRRES